MHFHRARLIPWAIVGALLAPIACNDATGPDDPVEGAALLLPFVSSVSLIELSPQPRAGQPFELTVNTFGFDGCWIRARTDVSVSKRGTIVTPYNRSLAATGTACTQALARIPHRVTLVVPAPGEHRLTVRGTDYETREPSVIRLTITVLP